MLFVATPCPMSWPTVCLPCGACFARCAFVIFRPTAWSTYASPRAVSLLALIDTAMVRLETSSSVSLISPFYGKGTSGQSVQKCRYRSVWPCSGRGRSAAWGKRSMTSL